MLRLIRYPRPHRAMRLLLGRRDITLDWRFGSLSGGGPSRYFIVRWGRGRRRWEWGRPRGPSEAGYHA